MKKTFFILTAVGVLNILLFIGIFYLLQNEKIYNHTLGLISRNYERTGGWDDFEIKKVSKPYQEIENENILTWDAAIYNCIAQRMYVKENECYGNVRAAFFPLFPLLWKMTGLSPVGISLLNYAFFIVSIAVCMLFLKLPLRDKIMYYWLLISMPFTIIYYIPYTESLFLLTILGAIIGIIKKKYWLFFSACLLAMTVRPAVIFVLFAFLFVEFIILIQNKDALSFFKRVTKIAIPFILGFIISLFIQYISSGSWNAFFEAQKYWSGQLQWIKNISDWSVEGFGMSVFALFFVCIPSLCCLISLFFPNNKKMIHGLQNSTPVYLFLLCVFYFTGIFLFTLFTSGGNLHSFYRFILATPFFFISTLLIIDRINGKSIIPILLLFLSCFLLMILFLFCTDYGGERIQFSFLGLYLLIVISLFILIRQKLPLVLQVIVSGELICSSLVWNTYLLNMFMSNAWIFT